MKDPHLLNLSATKIFELVCEAQTGSNAERLTFAEKYFLDGVQMGKFRERMREFCKYLSLFVYVYYIKILLF